MTNRPKIPAEVKREILLECGHRCAVDGTPLSLECAHIIPWHKSKEHKAEDMICLCANCHARADGENWGEKTLREYKTRPWVMRQDKKADDIPGPKIEVKLTIDIEVSHFEEKNQRWLQQAIAAFLKILPDDAKITSIEKGNSVKVTVELPMQSAKSLLNAYERKDPELFKYLAPLILLDVSGEVSRREQSQMIYTGYSMKKAGILLSGGGHPAINACVKGIRDALYRDGFKIYGIQKGFYGAEIGQEDGIELFEDFTDLSIDVNEASVLMNSREGPFTGSRDRPEVDMDRMEKIIKQLRGHKISLLVVLAGDGTARALPYMRPHLEPNHINVIPFPKSIDNDTDTKTRFRGVNYKLCPGFATAAMKIAQVSEAILRGPAKEDQRVFVIETMGRWSGDLAGACAYGYSEIILTPELLGQKNTREDFDRILKMFIDRVKTIYNREKRLTVGIGEGIHVFCDDEKCEHCQRSRHPHPIGAISGGDPRKLGGAADFIYRRIQEANVTDKVRIQKTDYVPRCGPPVEYDVLMGTILGNKVRHMIRLGNFWSMPVLREIIPLEDLRDLDRRIEEGDIEDQVTTITNPQFSGLPDEFYDNEHLTVNSLFLDMLNTICPRRKSPQSSRAS